MSCLLRLNITVRCLLLCVLTAVFVLYGTVSYAAGGASGSSERIITRGQKSVKTGNNAVLHQAGGVIAADSDFGSILRLQKGEYLALDAGRLLNPAEGAIVFWVRPHWDDTDKHSHTFLSMPWQSVKKSYLAFSRGWWEPAGAGLTYLIGNNQEHANTARHIRYTKGQWTHLAAVWSGGSNGFVRLYVNGMLVEENRNYTGQDRSGKALFLGSDRGSYLSAGRWADADFAELAFYRYGLNAREIRALYDSQVPVQPISQGHKAVEIRAIFDEGVGWQTERGAQEIIKRIKQAGFNLYIPCVWHGNGARFPTRVTETERHSRFVGRDPLERLIAIAHAQNIKVQPWFTVALREKWFGSLHPDFFDQKSPPHAFDLHRPAFQRFMTELVGDVAQRYQVDGINLDFIRTMGICHCDSCSSEYARRFQRSLARDAAQPNRDGTLEPHLQQWQDAAVETVVRDIRQRVKSVRPDAIISIAGRPQLFPNQEGRQEARLLNSGMVDLVFDMEYADPPDVERHHLAAGQFHDPDKLILLIANYDSSGARGSITKPKSGQRLVETVAYVRRRWGRGVGVYLYSMLDNDQVEQLGRVMSDVKALPIDGK